MPSGWMVALLVSSVLGTGAVGGMAMMNGDMMGVGMMIGSGHADCGMDGVDHMNEGMHCDPEHEHNEECEEHEYEECEEYQLNHEECEEEMEEQHHHMEHDDEEHDEEHEEGERHGCGMMG